MWVIAQGALDSIKWGRGGQLIDKDVELYWCKNMYEGGTNLRENIVL